MSDYKKTLSFNIDDGELYGMTQQQCFVLGFEFGSFCSWHNSEPIDGEHEFLVHAENGERFETFLTEKAIAYDIDAIANGWFSFIVIIDNALEKS